MHFVYIFLMLFTISYPLLKSFEEKVYFRSKWPLVFKATLPVAIFFILWDNWFTSLGVWTFNEHYHLGIIIGQLPLEEYLFFFFVPFSCLFIHEVLYYFIKKDILTPYIYQISWGLICTCFLILFLFPYNFYTVIVFSLTGFTLLLLVTAAEPLFLGRFYLTFSFTLVPFLLVNGLLTGLPVVLYNADYLSGIMIGSIPIEDMVYGFLFLLYIIGFYEYLKNKQTQTKP